MSNGDAVTVKLGLMPPLTGLVGIYGDEIVNAARIACDEVNEAGGVLGRPLELIIEDDGSLPESAVAAAEKLVSLHRCVAIIGNLLSNSRIAVAYRVAEPYKIPYLNFSFYEGSILSHYFFHFAALPNQQIDRMIPYMLKKYGPRMFFAGNNYEWPRGSIDAAKRALLQAGGQVLGEEYTAIGVAVPDIDRLLDKVEAARPDVFVPYFAGVDQVNLLTRFTERGMKSRMAVVMGHYDELMASKLPAEVREGFYSSNTYFMTLDTPENQSYLARLASLPGITGIWPNGNGILTNFGEGTYLCVKAFAKAANAAGSLESEALIKALGTIRITGPQGVVQMEPEAQHATVNTYLSRCNLDGVFEIVEKFGAIFPVMPDRYRHERVDNRATLEEDIRLQSRMLEQMSEAVMLVDTGSGTIIYANGGAYRMFGYERGEMIGLPIARLNSPHVANPEQVAADITSIITQTGSWKGNIQNIRKDGKTLWSAATVNAFTHPVHGEVWMSVHQDITALKVSEEKLQQSEERLQQVIASTNDGIWDWNVETGEDYLSPRWKDIFGYRDEELENRASTFFDMIHPDDRSAVAEAVKRHFEHKEPYRIEIRMRHKDGSYRWILTRGEAIRDATGRPVRMVGMIEDITQSKQAELNLREREERLRAIMDNANTVIFLKDSQGRYLDINTCYEKLFHVSREQIRGKTDHEIFPAEVAEALIKNDQAVIQSKRPIEIEEKVPQDDGLHTYLSVKFPLLDDTGEPYAVCGIATDITDRKRAEAEYKSILETSQDGFWMVSAQDGQLLDVNPAATRMLGYTRDEMLRMKIPDIEAAMHPEEIAQAVQQIVAGPIHETRFETRHRCSDGHIIDVEVSSQYLEARGGIFVAFIRDITDRKQAEANLIEAKRAAEAASQAKSSFLANMSHEIRTPMNAVLGLTWLVLDSGGLTQQQREYLRKAYNSSRMMLGVLNDILDYSKLESGLLTMERIPVRIEEVLQDVSGLFGAQIEQKGLELFFDIEPRTPAVVIGDPLRLKQVLNNLVGNAIKFTEQGEIQIGVEVEYMDGTDVMLRFAVRDTGIGI
ncbi:MAG: PAS domain S-box protein, partial [Gallionellaceae bacterium]|nr:PAS domain S-box protein [Gallionellaceae bacterium]